MSIAKDNDSELLWGATCRTLGAVSLVFSTLWLIVLAAGGDAAWAAMEFFPMRQHDFVMGPLLAFLAVVVAVLLAGILCVCGLACGIAGFALAVNQTPGKLAMPILGTIFNLLPIVLGVGAFIVYGFS